MKLRSVVIICGAILSLGLTSCDDAPADSDDYRYSLSDGPDICFQLIAKHLGEDVKLLSVISDFSTDKGTEEYEEHKVLRGGLLLRCDVDYQNPDKALELLHVTLDPITGEFSEPTSLELLTFGDDPDRFDFTDQLMALSDANVSNLKQIMDSQKYRLDKVYSKYGWSRIELTGPSAFVNDNQIVVSLSGKTTSNDKFFGGNISIGLDGTTILEDELYNERLLNFDSK